MVHHQPLKTLTDFRPNLVGTEVDKRDKRANGVQDSDFCPLMSQTVWDGSRGPQVVVIVDTYVIYLDLCPFVHDFVFIPFFSIFTPIDLSKYVFLDNGTEV